MACYVQDACRSYERDKNPGSPGARGGGLAFRKSRMDSFSLRGREGERDREGEKEGGGGRRGEGARGREGGKGGGKEEERERETGKGKAFAQKGGRG